MPNSTPALSATLWPEQGGAIVSLLDHTGYEWLAQPAGPRSATTVATRLFTDGRMSGWDECAPSISPCHTAAGDEIPDHGDLWDVPWSASSPDDGEWLTGHGSSLDYDLRRRVTSRPGGLRLEYVAEARSRPVPFFWSAHPQFRVAVDEPVVVGATPGEVSSVVDALAPGLPEVPWDDTLARLDSLPEPGSRKIVLLRDARVSSASVAALDGRRLTLSWDPDLLPCLAVWFDRRTFSREPVVAVEPATGWFDSLAVAEANGSAWSLAPGEPRDWWVDLTVG